MQFPSRRRVVVLLCSLLWILGCTTLRAQDSSAPPQAAPAQKEATPAPGPAAANDNSELATRDTPATFKVRVNLVQVRAVVRDAHGKVVDNLRKEDFELFDGRKQQVISTFSVETPSSRRIKRAAASPTGQAAQDTDAAETASMALPERFVAVVFDDGHMAMEDTTYVRDAATRLFGALSPTDRVGVYTTSGQFAQEFTSDRELLNKALLNIIPRPVMGSFGPSCPDVSYYQADQIENRHDSQALAVAAEDAVQCAFNGDHSKMNQAQSMATEAAIHALTAGDTENEYVYRHVEELLRRLAGMPGERVMVLVSPGFILSTLTMEASGIVDRANRANVVINTIDARGLYAPDVMGDIANPGRDFHNTAGYKASYRVAAQSAQSEVLADFALGTGGTFFHNRNDVDEGLRLAVAAPAVSYLLGFSPQNLKSDGRYHTIRVQLANKQKYSIQARHGYYAPRSVADPQEAAKEEIQEAVFSQEEIHDIPAELQTQFFKKEDAQARLSVVTRLDLKGIRFRKADGRNLDNLTIATAIFDEDGNFVTGGEKIVEMRLLETTYSRLSHSGLTIKSSFDVKPGKYLVRLVVRDAEGEQMAARNGAVVIPY